jgi:hypothetical protein
MLLALTGCDMEEAASENTEAEEVKIAYEANFYTNDGEIWFRTVGSKLDIQPNKVKEFGYNTDGSWTSWYETSSIISIYIDGKQVDSCGSTVIFADTALEPCDVDFYGIVSDGSQDGNISAEESRFSNYIKLSHWWYANKDTHGKDAGSKLIVIQSQTGKPIEMYMGKEVSWELGSLPKTTLVNIDGKSLYIHRANFAVIDTDMIVFDENGNLIENE